MGGGKRGQGFGGDDPLLAVFLISPSGIEPSLFFPAAALFSFLRFLKERNFSSSKIRGEIPRNPPNAVSGGNFIQPMPSSLSILYDLVIGLHLLHKLVREERLTDSNWGDYNMANLVFKPRKMSGEALEREMRNVWLDFY